MLGLGHLLRDVHQNADGLGAFNVDGLHGGDEELFGHGLEAEELRAAGLTGLQLIHDDLQVYRLEAAVNLTQEARPLVGGTGEAGQTA